jgi:hypothetical protein
MSRLVLMQVPGPKIDIAQLLGRRQGDRERQLQGDRGSSWAGSSSRRVWGCGVGSSHSPVKLSRVPPGWGGRSQSSQDMGGEGVGVQGEPGHTDATSRPIRPNMTDSCDARVLAATVGAGCPDLGCSALGPTRKCADATSDAAATPGWKHGG